MPSSDDAGTAQTVADQYEQADDRPESPYDGADLVIYSAEAEWADEEPKHENLEELGLVSWSLWARWEERGVEIPIVGESSWHYWYSLNPDTFEPDPADPVTDAFVASIVEMVDEDVADGWGGIREETWNGTRDVEKYIIILVKEGFLEMKAAEPAMIIDWCHKQYDRGGDDAE